MKVAPRPGRRSVLRIGAAGTVALATFPLGCGSGGASPPSGPFTAGNVSAVPTGALHIVPGENAFLGHDAGGLYAMSAVCTHSGCLVTQPPDGMGEVPCLCHGSLFDRNGAVLRGPATSPLQHYHVDVASDGTITVQGDMPVAATERTPTS
jgi:Rieske Fe-S protein